MILIGLIYRTKDLKNCKKPKKNAIFFKILFFLYNFWVYVASKNDQAWLNFECFMRLNSGFRKSALNIPKISQTTDCIELFTQITCTH